MGDFDELVERVKALTNLDGRAAFKIADALADQSGDEPPSPAQIIDQAQALGYEVEHPERPGKDAAPENAEPLPEISTNPVEVLAAVYRECPRVLMTEVPRIGRAPKESVFYDEALQEAMRQLPEDLRLLIADLDLYNEQLTVTLYDEANDLDRKIGPIPLDRFERSTVEESFQALRQAITTLIGRLPRVLNADLN